MVTKTGKTERKQTSRGQRKHVRRMKQEARRTSIPDNPIKNKKRASEAPKE
jgi:hypothetical protein